MCRSMGAWAACAMLAVALLGGCRARPVGQQEAEAAGGQPRVGGLPGLYQALEGLESHSRTAPVVILQIGDSHTEDDALSGRMRALFQARFGDAGRGPLPPGRPTRWYKPQQVSVATSGHWRMDGARPGPASGPFGIAGMSATADTAEAEMVVTATGADGFDRAAVELLHQPGGGTLDVLVDDRPVAALASAAEAPGAAWHDIASARGSRTMTLRPRGDGPVTVLMWDTRRAGPGVVYANLGIVGATVGILERWDPAFVAREVAALRPALLLVAFGTNEGFNPALDLAAYRDRFAAQLRRLRALAPDAAIMVVGPPDGNEVTGHEVAPRVVKGRAPRRQVRQSPSGCVGERSQAGARRMWTVPRNLDAVRSVQREAAAVGADFFWDWSGVMGGACGMDRWVQADPPLGAKDHVHLQPAGYEQTADRLFDELMVGYERYRAAKRAR